MRLSFLARLALAGTRTDVLRVLLTGASAALATVALLAAATVLAIAAPPDGAVENAGYTSALLREPGLRPGVAVTLLLMTIPVLALAGQCARIGAPARDRRLAAIRLAGGTPRQAVAVAVAETGGAALLGALAGSAIQLAARELLHRPDADGRLTLPTDVTVPPLGYAIIVLGVPLLAMPAAALLLRRVSVSPLGVRRRVSRPAPGPWPGVLILLGLGGYLALLPAVGRGGATDWVPAVVLGGSLLTTLGVVLGVGWISATTGRLLHRFARRPATLLAARDLMADPWHGSRTLSALLAALVIGAGAQSARAHFIAQDEAYDGANRVYAELTGRSEEFMTFDAAFYIGATDMIGLAILVSLALATGGLLVALLERVFSQRRTHSALLAAGVPRGVLAGAVAWRVLAPALPAIALALSAGTVLGRGFFGTEVSSGRTWVELCDGPAAACADPEGAAEPPRLTSEELPEVVRAIDVPFVELGLLGAGAAALVVGTVVVATLCLRRGATPTELRSA
ncbi:ABC transporter permease [Streptomyces hainanensis]|uniref:ABC transporter permease n=2 Tax=Streptomyces hainanensis TaxID=402648 RepID=A0A4V2Y3M4_9ACTN|nr:ABC transporter permease [Streptomyces hainanensis]